jgi:hypothetical protein
MKFKKMIFLRSIYYEWRYNYSVRYNNNTLNFLQDNKQRKLYNGSFHVRLRIKAAFAKIGLI